MCGGLGGMPRQMFEISQNISHTQAKRENYKKIIDFNLLVVICSFDLESSIPFLSHLNATYLHWNLIGI